MKANGQKKYSNPPTQAITTELWLEVVLQFSELSASTERGRRIWQMRQGINNDYSSHVVTCDFHLFSHVSSSRIPLPNNTPFLVQLCVLQKRREKLPLVWQIWTKEFILTEIIGIAMKNQVPFFSCFGAVLWGRRRLLLLFFRIFISWRSIWKHKTWETLLVRNSNWFKAVVKHLWCSLLNQLEMLSAPTLCFDLLLQYRLPLPNTFPNPASGKYDNTSDPSSWVQHLLKLAVKTWWKYRLLWFIFANFAAWGRQQLLKLLHPGSVDCSS